MTKISIQEALQNIRTKLVSAGFVQIPAHEITLHDHMYDGISANVARAVPVVGIMVWRNKSVHIVCKHYSGNIGDTYNPNDMLWIVPRS